MNENVSKSSRTSDFVLRLLLLSGILLALLGVGIDYVLPNTSPGLNLPQLLVIAAGLALALGAHQLRREERTAAVCAAGIGWNYRDRRLLISLTVTLVIALEIVLAILRYVETYIPADIICQNFAFQPVNWQDM